MSKEILEVLVEGGKAKSSPQMGQTLGPLKINIQEVLSEINKKTSSFNGMKVPVKVIVDTESKQFEIEVGSPPISELIKNELNLKKGSGQPNLEFVGNLAIEQVIKIAKMKKDAILANDLKSVVNSVVGSCNAMGVLVEGKRGKDVIKDIKDGAFDKEISEEKTEVSEEKRVRLEEELKRMQNEFKKVQEKVKEEAEKKEEKKEEVKEETKEEKKGEKKKKKK